MFALSYEKWALKWKSLCSTLLVAMCRMMLLGNQEAKAVRERLWVPRRPWQVPMISSTWGCTLFFLLSRYFTRCLWELVSHWQDSDLWPRAVSSEVLKFELVKDNLLIIWGELVPDFRAEKSNRALFQFLLTLLWPSDQYISFSAFGSSSWLIWVSWGNV